MDARSQRFWELHDFAVGHGLEVGPLHRAIVTRDVADVSYVDVTDRDRLVAHYAGDPDVPPDSIPEIDFWLIDESGETRTLVEATKAGAPFDWVMASHVIEHVPDIIGWLGELAEVVVDDGRLVLAVPDRRYEFDVHRPASTVGQMLQAHESGDQRPSVAAVYDHFSSAVRYDPRGVWEGRLPTFEDRIHTPDQARELLARSLGGEYIDSHVWLLTPESFIHHLHELRVGGWSSWIVEKVIPTPTYELEFQAVLRRLPRDAETTGQVDGEILPTYERPIWVTDIGSTSAGEALAQRIEKLEARLESKNDTLRQLRRKVRSQRRKLQRLDGGATPAPAATGLTGLTARARAAVRAFRTGR
ncbi:MAG TPA: methyltransferase domain-containing protein [Nocardioides sp.]|uniref:methyltransferase domain-containing protein n=1 Tax=uncultured Nocardioides sp. TaxID=198441 RepID=UPI000EBCC18D|nr:methyltransferase domain-containing protein [uncultured Nocardioides sp.]HCB06534.1 hypothetical protein [Nocardioides sp.]HRD61009.1 methyltransferase domain-containing protein [Nocardioides sp.]HRI94339.1 methyltransferase domain-containing protein [Nocardioides sp.]HRK44562.1 methyltransferase domain-containing protein [Nocardioides sp.]